ncbi:MAG: rhodanese-like domain-containing protein [Gemmataceae bacterium]
MEVESIRPRDLMALRSSGQIVELLDVRTPVEFREIHVPFARNVPLSELDAAALARERVGRAAEPLYVICRSGSRGKQACDQLVKAGMVKAINVEGGTLAWAECGLPIARGKKALSLERQVRLTVGLLVMIASLLTWLVHPYFFVLTMAVGAGLFYSGATDTCAMALLLARLPWNRAVPETPTVLAPQCAAPGTPSSVG